MFSTWPTPQALADALRANKTITSVDLRNNNFGDEGVKARPPPHKGDGQVSHFTACWTQRMTPQNLLSFIDAQAVVDAFRANETVTALCLGRNNFGNEGLKARALQQGHGWADEPMVLYIYIYRFGMVWDFCSMSQFVSISLAWVLRNDLSTHSAARRPRPWRL